MQLINYMVYSKDSSFYGVRAKTIVYRIKNGDFKNIQASAKYKYKLKNFHKTL